MRRAEIMGVESLIPAPKPRFPGLPAAASVVPSVPKPTVTDPLASRLSGLVGGNDKITVDGDSSDSSSESEAPEVVSNSKSVVDDGTEKSIQTEPVVISQVDDEKSSAS